MSGAPVPKRAPSWTTFTGKVREMERIVRAMPNLGAPAFRLFSAVAQGLNEGTGKFKCRDEIMAVLCGVKTRQSISTARSALQDAGVLGFIPGRPGKSTIYWTTMSDDDLLDAMAVLEDRKRDARDKTEDDQSHQLETNMTTSLDSAATTGLPQSPCGRTGRNWRNLQIGGRRGACSEGRPNCPKSPFGQFGGQAHD